MNNFTSYEISNPNNATLLSEIDAIVAGSLVGGNLSLICSTPYEINTVDKILFLEEISESPYKIDGMLTQLILSKKIKSCSGIILGQFSNYGVNNCSKSLYLNEVIKDRLLNTAKSIIGNLMTGHCNPNLTIPIGSKVRLNY